MGRPYRLALAVRSPGRHQQQPSPANPSFATPDFHFPERRQTNPGSLAGVRDLDTIFGPRFAPIAQLEEQLTLKRPGKPKNAKNTGEMATSDCRKLPISASGVVIQLPFFSAHPGQKRKLQCHHHCDTHSAVKRCSPDASNRRTQSVGLCSPVIELRPHCPLASHRRGMTLCSANASSNLRSTSFDVGASAAFARH